MSNMFLERRRPKTSHAAIGDAWLVSKFYLFPNVSRQYLLNHCWGRTKISVRNKFIEHIRLCQGQWRLVIIPPSPKGAHIPIAISHIALPATLDSLQEPDTAGSWTARHANYPSMPSNLCRCQRQASAMTVAKS